MKLDQPGSFVCIFMGALTYNYTAIKVQPTTFKRWIQV